MEQIIAYIVFNVDAPNPPVYYGPDGGLASFELAASQREEPGEAFRCVEITKVRTGSDGRTVIRSRETSFGLGEIEGEVIDERRAIGT